MTKVQKTSKNAQVPFGFSKSAREPPEPPQTPRELARRSPRSPSLHSGFLHDFGTFGEPFGGFLGVVWDLFASALWCKPLAENVADPFVGTALWQQAIKQPRFLIKPPDKPRWRRAWSGDQLLWPLIKPPDKPRWPRAWSGDQPLWPQTWSTDKPL